MEEKIKSWDSSIDILRILACFLVIVNHSNSSIFMKYYPSLTGQVSLLIFYISKCAVGIFFMISGALLLKKEADVKSNFKYRFLRMFIVFMVFSFWMYLIYNVKSYDLTKVNLAEFLKVIISKPVITPYWYLYVYMMIILLLPFLSKLAGQMKDEDYRYMLISGFVIFGVFPFIFKLMGTSAYLKLDSVFSGICFMFCGHYMYNVCDRDKLFCRKNLYIVLAAGALTLAFSMAFSYYEFSDRGKLAPLLDGMNTFNNAIIAVVIFYLVVYAFSKKKLPEKVSRTLRFIGGTTFGTYLIHSRCLVRTNFIYKAATAHMNPLIAVFIWQIVVFVVCTVIMAVVKQIPGVKKLL